MRRCVSEYVRREVTSTFLPRFRVIECWNHSPTSPLPRRLWTSVHHAERTLTRKPPCADFFCRAIFDIPRTLNAHGPHRAIGPAVAADFLNADRGRIWLDDRIDQNVERNQVRGLLTDSESVGIFARKIPDGHGLVGRRVSPACANTQTGHCIPHTRSSHRPPSRRKGRLLSMPERASESG